MPHKLKNHKCKATLYTSTYQYVLVRRSIKSSLANQVTLALVCPVPGYSCPGLPSTGLPNQYWANQYLTTHILVLPVCGWSYNRYSTQTEC